MLPIFGEGTSDEITRYTVVRNMKVLIPFLSLSDKEQ
jgi:hypothetical protein